MLKLEQGFRDQKSCFLKGLREGKCCCIFCRINVLSSSLDTNKTVLISQQTLELIVVAFIAASGVLAEQIWLIRHNYELITIIIAYFNYYYYYRYFDYFLCQYLLKWGKHNLLISSSSSLYKFKVTKFNYTLLVSTCDL